LEKESPSGAELHLVERINMGFSVQNAILNVPNLTRFKVSGHLPQLQLNFSDTKYSEYGAAVHVIRYDTNRFLYR
jgi:vacuolar protein sorting-associated protein 13A/C